jgi:predicted phosphoribosyltransferase
MIRLMTALLILDAIVATGATAIAGCNTCNPNAPRCRQICPPPRHPRHHAILTQTPFATVTAQAAGQFRY